MYYRTIVLLLNSELAVGNKCCVGIIVLRYSVLYEFFVLFCFYREAHLCLHCGIAASRVIYPICMMYSESCCVFIAFIVVVVVVVLH